jgi:hypothetical protein
MTIYYDVARLANTMGMQTTVMLDPTKITMRVKNNIKKQLRQGHIVGGWRGNATKIAEALTNTLKLPVARCWWRGVRLNNASLEVRKRILELYEADWTAWVLENPFQTHSHYYTKQRKEISAALTQHKPVSLDVVFQDTAFRDQAVKYLATCMTSEAREQIERAIDLLDGTKPIHIITYQ